MPGLGPGIHVLRAGTKAWMAGTSLDKPGHDEFLALRGGCFVKG
jgi:hypothetical protein